MEDEYGLEMFQVRLYYRGPLRWRGDPRAIRLDISHDEYLGGQAVDCGIIHPYSDQEYLSGVSIPCYDLVEMLAEKLRALSGQRRYAIARDLYEVYQLLTRAGLDASDVRPLLRGKFQAKGMSMDVLAADRLSVRRDEFEQNGLGTCSICSRRRMLRSLKRPGKEAFRCLRDYDKILMKECCLPQIGKDLWIVWHKKL